MEYRAMQRKFIHSKGERGENIHKKANETLTKY